jgi:hypothetical protein
LYQFKQPLLSQGKKLNEAFENICFRMERIKFSEEKKLHGWNPNGKLEKRVDLLEGKRSHLADVRIIF